jgi:hypothetical protein
MKLFRFPGHFRILFRSQTEYRRKVRLFLTYAAFCTSFVKEYCEVAAIPFLVGYSNSSSNSNSSCNSSSSTNSNSNSSTNSNSNSNSNISPFITSTRTLCPYRRDEVLYCTVQCRESATERSMNNDVNRVMQH